MATVDNKLKPNFVTKTNDKHELISYPEKGLIGFLVFTKKDEEPKKSKLFPIDFETLEEVNNDKSQILKNAREFFKLDSLSEEDEKYYSNKLQQAFIDTISYLNEFPQHKRIHRILLSKLDEKNIHRIIEAVCKIVGEGERKAIPTEVNFRCRDCGEQYTWTINTDLDYFTELDEDSRDDYLDILQVLINTPRGNLPSFLKKKADDFLSNECSENSNNKHRTISVKSKGNTKYQEIFIKDDISIRSRDSRDVTSEAGKAIKSYLIGSETNGSKKVVINGTLVVDNKDNIIRPIIFQINPLVDELQYFSLTEKDKEDFKIFRNLRDEIIDETIAPTVIKRLNAKLATLLTLHSVLEFKYRNEYCYGLLRTLFFGDTKTCKSTILEDVILNVNLGEFLNCETSSRTGLVYTIDNDTKTTIWGSFVDNDLGFVGLDGFQQLKGEELASMREVLEKGKVSVRRFASGDAFARVRIVACANPTKDMINYIYKCEALTPRSVNYEDGFKPFSSTPDVTRWHIFIPFSTKDVDSDEFLTKDHEKRQQEKEQGIVREKIDSSILRRHVLWVWSRSKEQIQLTEEATIEVLRESDRLQESYSWSSLPIIHNGFHEVVARVSVAFACLYHSTDETNEIVIVNPEHVEYAIEFLEEMIANLELSAFIYAKKHQSVILDDERKEILNLISISPNRQILEALAIKGTCSSKVLAEICETSEKTIKRRLPGLQAKNLIESTRGVGSSLTDKGTQAVKEFIKNSSEPEQNSLSLDGDIKTFFEKIKELTETNTNCTWVNLTDALPDINGIQSKLVILEKQGLIDNINGQWRARK